MLSNERTLLVSKQARKAALDEQRAVVQQRAHKAPRRKLAQQVDRKLQKPLAKEQLLVVERRVLSSRTRLRGLRHNPFQHLHGRPQPCRSGACPCHLVDPPALVSNLAAAACPMPARLP